MLVSSLEGIPHMVVSFMVNFTIVESVKESPTKQTKAAYQNQLVSSFFMGSLIFVPNSNLPETAV